MSVFAEVDEALARHAWWEVDLLLELAVRAGEITREDALKRLFPKIAPRDDAEWEMLAAARKRREL